MKREVLIFGAICLIPALTGLFLPNRRWLAVFAALTLALAIWTFWPRAAGISAGLDRAGGMLILTGAVVGMFAGGLKLGMRALGVADWIPVVIGLGLAVAVPVLVWMALPGPN